MGRRRKFLVAAAVVAVLVVLTYLTSRTDLLSRAAEINARLHSFGWAAPVVFVAGVTILVAIGVPRLLLCPLGGLAFGFLEGLLWTQLGTLAGSYLTFLFARWGGRDFVLRHWPRMHDYSVQFAQKGSLSVFLARQIPISGLWVNCLLGLTHVGHRDFLVGTTIGMLPEAIPATLVGASAAQVDFAKTMSYLFAAVAWFVIIAVVWRWLRRSGRLGVAAPPRAENAGLETGNDVENQP